MIKIVPTVVKIPTQSKSQSSCVSVVEPQSDGSILVGLWGTKQVLFKYINGKFEDLNFEKHISTVLGVTGGLRSSLRGETVLSVLHWGIFSFLKGPLSQKSNQLLAALKKSEDLFGLKSRASIVQLHLNQLTLRREKDPGVLFDVDHLGDYVFGMTPEVIFREPYLHPEKRETIRKNLALNLKLHRDSAGNTWMLGENGRFLRKGQTDHNATPTPLKWPINSSDTNDLVFRISTPGVLDDFLYGATESLFAKTNKSVLFRLRRNLISQEDEIQSLAQFDGRIGGLIIKKESINEILKTVLYVFVELQNQVQCFRSIFDKPIDPELIPEPPLFESVAIIEGLQSIGNLCVTDQGQVWCSDTVFGVQGSSQLNLINFQLP